MIITCPKCAMHYDIAEEFLPSGQQEFECPNCQHSWLHPKDTAKNISRKNGIRKPRLPPPALPVAVEAARLAQASSVAQGRFKKQREHRAATFRGWAVLAFCIIFCATTLISFPQTVIRFVPATVKLYALAGMTVNVRGIDFRKLSYVRSIEGGIVVLAINGEITNITSHSKDVPVLRLALQDGNAQEIYTWKVKLEDQIIKPGQAVKFTTRLAAPPNNISAVQIRFAAGEEIG